MVIEERRKDRGVQVSLRPELSPKRSKYLSAPDGERLKSWMLVTAKSRKNSSAKLVMMGRSEVQEVRGDGTKRDINDRLKTG